MNEGHDEGLLSALHARNGSMASIADEGFYTDEKTMNHFQRDEVKH